MHFTISLPYLTFVSLTSNFTHLLVVLVLRILKGEGSFCEGYYGKKREFINKIIL